MVTDRRAVAHAVAGDGRALGGAPLQARLRAQPDDFFVNEDLGFVPDGSGEHVLLRVEKRGANTEWVAKAIARFVGVAPEAVGYAGLKDRHAVTRQSFSVPLSQRQERDWTALASDEFHVLEVQRPDAIDAPSRGLENDARFRARFARVWTPDGVSFYLRKDAAALLITESP